MPKLTGDRSQRVSDRILKFFRYENELTGTHTLFYENIRVDLSPPLKTLELDLTVFIRSSSDLCGLTKVHRQFLSILRNGGLVVKKDRFYQRD